MKKLTKVLSLVLVIAMVISLCVVGVSANNYEPYTDADTVGEAYKEATDVMIGAGIVAGMNATTLAPTGNYTRAQAAKIVAYMRLGAQAADALTCNVAPFSDVPTSYWAAGFISYCKSMGIIDGYGNGKYGPEDTLTGYQWGKMCLTVLGYGANKEYNKVDWTIAVAKDAIPLGIYDGDMAAACSTPIQRQQAILMAFNTFTKGLTVSYSALLGTYTTSQTLNGTVTGVTLAESMYKIFKAEGTVNASEKIDGVATDATAEEVGRDAHVWYQTQGKKNVQISNVYLDDTVLGTSVDGTTLATLATKTSSKYIAQMNTAVTYYVDGEVYDNVTTGDSKDVYESAPDGALDVTVGDKVTFIDTDADGKTNVVFVQHETSGVVRANAYTNNTSTAGETTTIPGTDVAAVATSDLVLEKTFAKGDVVTVQTKRDGLTYVNSAATVEGTLDAITKTVIANDTFTVGTDSLLKGHDFANDGMTAYTKASDVTNDNLTIKGTFYKGTEGYCIGVKFDSTPLYNLCYVIAVQPSQLGTLQAKLLLPDGTTPVVNIEKVDTYTVNEITLDNGNAEVFPDTIYQYAETTNGYALTTKDNANVAPSNQRAVPSEAPTYSYTSGATTLNNAFTEPAEDPELTGTAQYIVDSKTIGFAQAIDNKGNVSYKAFVGAANMPSMNADSPYVVVAADGKTVLAMYFGNGVNMADTTNIYYGVVAAVTSSGANGSTATATVINSANLTGESLTVEGNVPEKSDFIEYYKTTDGKIVTSYIPYTEFSSLDLSSSNDEYITYQGDVLKLAADAKGYYITPTMVKPDAVMATTIGANSANETLAYVVMNKDKTEVTEVWYVPVSMLPTEATAVPTRITADTKAGAYYGNGAAVDEALETTDNGDATKVMVFKFDVPENGKYKLVIFANQNGNTPVYQEAPADNFVKGTSKGVFYVDISGVNVNAGAPGQAYGNTTLTLTEGNLYHYYILDANQDVVSGGFFTA